MQVNAIYVYQGRTNYNCKACYARRQDCNYLYSAQESFRGSSRGTPGNCQHKESFKDGGRRLTVMLNVYVNAVTVVK